MGTIRPISDHRENSAHRGHSFDVVMPRVEPLSLIFRHRRFQASRTAPPLAATKSRFFATLRSAPQKLDELVVSVEQFRPSGPEGALPAFARPERPWHCRPLIPGGDRYSSRGQRPRKTRPQQGPPLKGSNPGGVTPVLRLAAQGDTTLPGSGKERGAFRGRCPRLVRLRARSIGEVEVLSKST